MLVVDVQPPSPRDPDGIHGAIWPEVGGDADYKAPAGKPLTLAAYEAAFPKNAYVEPIAVGDELLAAEVHGHTHAISPSAPIASSPSRTAAATSSTRPRP